MNRALKRALDGSLLLLALLVLGLSVTDRVARAATADGGLNASGEAGAPSELVTDAGADADLPPESAPLKCDGALCDTTTGETTCSMSEGGSAKRGVWPFVMLLALAAAGIKRRAQSRLQRGS
jgi:hypothetical protein